MQKENQKELAKWLEHSKYSKYAKQIYKLKIQKSYLQMLLSITRETVV